MSKYQLVPANTNLKDVLKIALFAFKFTYAQEEPESVIDGIHGASMLMEISEDIGDITQIDAWLELQDQLSNLDTVPSDYVPAMTYLYTETERNIAEDYWCNNLLVEEIAEKYKLSRSGLYRTVDVIKEKMNIYLKYVVFYNNDYPPTKGDFLTFLKNKGEFFEN